MIQINEITFKWVSFSLVQIALQTLGISLQAVLYCIRNICCKSALSAAVDKNLIVAVG